MGPSILKLPSSILIILYNGSGGIPVANLTARNTSLSLPGIYNAMRVPVDVQNFIPRYKKRYTVEANVPFSGTLYQQSEVCRIQSHLACHSASRNYHTVTRARYRTWTAEYDGNDTCVFISAASFITPTGSTNSFYFQPSSATLNLGTVSGFYNGSPITPKNAKQVSMKVPDTSLVTVKGQVALVVSFSSHFATHQRKHRRQRTIDVISMCIKERQMTLANPHVIFRSLHDFFLQMGLPKQ